MAVLTHYLQRIEALAELSPQQQQLLASIAMLKTYSTGQLLFLDGDESIGLWFVVEGKIRILKHSENGRVQAICIMHSGKCFGGCPLYSMETNPATAQALTDVSLVILPTADLVMLQAQQKTIVDALIRVYADRLSLLASLTEKLSRWSVNHRIEDVLRANCVSEDARLCVPLTHEQIAHLAGTSREVVTRYLTRLENNQIIEQQRGAILILDAAFLGNSCIIDNESLPQAT